MTSNTMTAPFDVYSGGTVTSTPRTRRPARIDFVRELNEITRSQAGTVLSIPNQYDADLPSIVVFIEQLIAAQWGLYDTAYLPAKMQRTATSKYVATHFSNIADVQMIYVETMGNTLVYWVFTNEAEYDSVLLDRLIDEEMAVMDAFPQASLDFHFISLAMGVSPSDVVGVDATIVYSRENG